MSTTLRDFVASELSKLPGSRTLTLHALVSSPQREQELFPYAQIPKNHKILSQNILLLVSEDVGPNTSASADATITPRILCSALEATLYLFPATSSSILYIGKIDTTGFSKVAPSPARTLARATIDYFVRPDMRPAECGQRVWVHLFARAQSQYLFPDSAEWKSKRVLNDAGLVRWWWSLFGDVARDVAEVRGGQLESRFKGTKMWYILPGFNDIEAYHTLSSGSSFKLVQAGELPWSYGHPYDDPSVSFPLSGKPTDHTTAHSSHRDDSTKTKSIAYLIPTFPDDPKARFLGEIASTTSESDVPPPAPKPTSKPASPTTPTRKLRSASSPKSSGSSSHSAFDSPSQSPLKKRRRVDVDNPPANTSNPEGGAVATNEKPVSNAPPSGVASKEDAPAPLPHGPAQLKNTTHTEPELVRRGRLALSAVSAKEFWERMGFRQECALGAVTAFFVAVFEESETLPKPDSKIANEYIPLPTHTRIMQSLMNHAFSTPEKAIRSTQLLESSIRTLSDGVVAAAEGAETENSNSSFYHAHIHKSLTNNNPPLVPRDGVVQPAPVNVLQVKRKARR
ncbi:hypothetical protein FRC11_002038 [Ceratobasidium sp. 423]|nr:hypothetical protein FRC11_002038 [Ceratobasidium sp. 423]